MRRKATRSDKAIGDIDARHVATRRDKSQGDNRMSRCLIVEILIVGRRGIVQGAKGIESGALATKNRDRY